MRPENEWFKPEKLKAYVFVYEGFAAALTAGSAALFVAMGGPEEVPTLVTAGGAVAVLAVFAFLTWWIPAFYRTAAYRFGEDEVEYRRGVFFRQRTNVPYNRITNVGTTQGPVQRLVGAGSVAVHTAGYGGQMGAELTIGGVADFEEIEAQVLGKVRRRPPEAVEGEPAGETEAWTEPVARGPVERTGEESDVLAELRRIRELLERDRERERGTSRQ